MRRVQEVLRLLLVCGLSQRQASRVCGVGRASVAEYMERAKRAGLLEGGAWESWSGEELERRLYPQVAHRLRRERPAVDFRQVHEELKRKGVTLSLVWEEYREGQPDGYQYSRFCDLYREWRGRLDLCMRQVHRPGEKLFVDYAGSTVPVIDAGTGEVREAQIFVAVWGASNYTFAEATWSQGLSDWIGSHVRAFEFAGGSTAIVVPDNLRSGVTRACRYEPELNPTYHDLAMHYGVAVIPARVRKPRDKAKVEAGVLLVQRWILARLRQRKFFSLAELNTAIGELLVRLNERAFRKQPGSRRSLFESVERPALRPLPEQRFLYAEWAKARVHVDYHVAVDGHYYSVPYQLVSQQVDVRFTAKTVECFAKSKRVASHLRSFRRGKHTTLTEHMPRPHRDYVEWTPERLVRWAQKTGPSVAGLIETVMATRVHPQQGFRSCLGILRLSQRYGDERLEAACRRALEIRGFSYRSVHSILASGLDRNADSTEPEAARPLVHENLRGPSYYSSAEQKPC
ncbi:MAG TPA: IS21 family transposase [Thermoanaerobaculia bacterium]|nr:IS21 family transposase [Thermoanaerobaculia bacterium]